MPLSVSSSFYHHFVFCFNPLVCHSLPADFKEVNKNGDEYKSIVVTPNKYIFSVFLQAISKMHHLLNSIL